MRKHLTFLSIVAFVLLGLWLSQPALAMLWPLNLEDLTRQAEMILTGHVVDLKSERDDKQGMIYTYATIAVDRTLKGEQREQVVVQVPGGEVGQLGLWVSDTPEFAVGQQVLLFLAGKDNLQPVGWQQGKYTIQDGVLLENERALSDVLRVISKIVKQSGSRSPALSEADLDMRGFRRGGQYGPAYAYSGQKWFGPNPMGEPYYIYENTEDTVGEGAAIQAAARTWSEVQGADFRFTYGGPTTREVPVLDGYNVIRWNTGLGGPIAIAYMWYYYPSGQIIETDIAFDDDWNWSAGESCPPYTLDVQNFAAHELGHWLHLGDLYNSADSEKTMYGYGSYEETKKRTLHSDDIEGIRFIYPQLLAPETRSVAPSSGWSRPGTWQYFTTVYRDADGWQNIRYADFLASPTSTGTRYAHLRYDVQANRVFIHHPTESYWIPTEGLPPGTSGVINSTYARLDVAHSSMVANTDTLTVTWALWFKYKASGRVHNLYLYVEDMDGNHDGWDDYGDWTVNAKPSLPYLSPAEGSLSTGQWYEFVTRYADADGRTTLDEVYLLITTSWARTRYAVYLKYDQGENKLYLRNAADTAWLGPITPKTAGAFLENEYCILRGDWSRTGAYDSKTLTVRWWLQFKPAFPGRHNIYMKAVDNLGPALNGATGLWYKGWVEVR